MDELDLPGKGRPKRRKAHSRREQAILRLHGREALEARWAAEDARDEARRAERGPSHYWIGPNGQRFITGRDNLRGGAWVPYLGT